MHVPFFPLAAIGNLDAEAVSYQFIGMLVVFCCLGLLSIILTISGSVAVRVEAKRNARQAAAKAALTSSAAASSPTPSEPSPQQIAALAAGIYNTAASSITPELVAAIAAAVGASRAFKILIPVNRCNHYIAGCAETPMSDYIRSAVEKLEAML